MLEGQTLLLRPWATVPAPPGFAGTVRARPVFDADSGKPLGVAHRWAAPAPAWLQWLAPPTVVVHEAGDEPLLCTVRSLWGIGPLWEVLDADGRRVAAVSRRRIRNRLGREVARRVCQPDGAAVWRGQADGRELATVTPSADGVRLHFAGAVTDEPFVKMALLGATLVLSPCRPGDGA